jgi:hypothetical protein
MMSMIRNGRTLRRLAIVIAGTLLLAGCAAATPAWGPDSPRNGAGQYVDPHLGTALPGQTMGYN